MKKIIDVCCGNKMIWFDKKNPDVLFLDNRSRPKGFLKERPNFEIKPDKIADFTNLNFIPNNRYNLVVWDPPHCIRKIPELGIITKKYGSLGPNWKEILAKGFKECWRILRPEGVLIFKWNEKEKKLIDILKLFSEKPLFGHTSGSRAQTHWLCFYKKKLI